MALGTSPHPELVEGRTTDVQQACSARTWWFEIAVR